MAITIKDPAGDLGTALNAQTVGGVALATGINLFTRQIHPMPMSLVVSLLNTGGSTPEPYLSPTASAYFRPAVQVLVYGTPGEDGFVAGEALSRGVLGQLQQATVSGYVSIRFQESQPTYVGPDPETMRHVWSMNLAAEYVG